MKKVLNVFAVMLILCLNLCVFAGCDTKEAQGSSSVMTQSDVTNTEKDEDLDSDTSSKPSDKLPSAGTASKPEPDSDSDSNKTTSVSRPAGKTETTKATVYKKGFPITKEKITLEIMGLALPSRGDAEKMSQFKYYEKETNIKTVYIGVVEYKYKERVAAAIQSGDMPDVFAGVSFDDDELIKYTSRQDDVFVDVRPYLKDWAPNIQKLLDTDAVAKGLNLSHDGKLYTLPKMRKSKLNYDNWLNIRKDWLDELKLEIPRTPEEFLEIMRAFRDKDPNKNGKKDEIPYAITGWNANFIMSWWGVRADGNYIGIDRDGKVYCPYATKNAKAAAIFWNKLRAEDGLMKDKNGPGKSGTNSFPGILSGGNLGCFAWSHLASRYISEDLLKKYVAIPYPTANFKNSEINVSAVAQPFNNMPSRGSITITKACENLEAALRYFDYFYTADGVMLGNWGSPDGGNYKKNKDGTYTITNNELIGQDGDYSNAMGWAMGIADMHKVFPQLLIKENYVDPNINPAYDAYEKAAIKTYAKAHRENPTYCLPNVHLSAEEIAALRKYVFSNRVPGPGTVTSYVTGYRDISKFDQYVSEWKKDGLDDYISIYQKIVDRNRPYLLDTGTYAN